MKNDKEFVRHWTGIITVKRNGKLVPKTVDMVTFPDIDGENELSMTLKAFVKMGKKIISNKNRSKAKKQDGKDG